MKILALMGKGGVGKSTLAVEFAKYLQTKGTVLVVGLDQQHNANDMIKSQNLNIEYKGLYTQDKMTTVVESIIDNTMLKNFKSYAPFVAPDLITICALAELMYDLKNVDYVVIDFPPNHAGLGMINFPNILENITFKALTIKNRVKKLVKGKDEALTNLDYIYKIVIAFKEIAQHIQYYCVSLPTTISEMETGKLIKYLTELRYFNFHIIVNMVPISVVRAPGEMPYSSVCEICDRRFKEAENHVLNLQNVAKTLGVGFATIDETFEVAQMESDVKQCLDSLMENVPIAEQLQTSLSKRMAK